MEVYFCQDSFSSLALHYDGLFEVLARVEMVAYRLALPEWLKLHPVFHISFLKKFHDDPDPERRREVGGSRAP